MLRFIVFFGGIDFYTNAISDIYQDYFKEGIFTGKGIYDVNVYNTILKDEIPENVVLSHDLLEGNFLRCGLLTDVQLLDGYPSKYISYITRNHRWTRGDWQITRWLRSKKLNEISKFKIYDNLRRSLIKPLVLLGLLISMFMYDWVIFSICLVSLNITYLLEIINYIIYKKSNITGAIYSNQNFSKKLDGFFLSFVKIIFELAFLPYEAYQNIDACLRVCYRKIKKKKMLEWTTSEDGDKACLSTISFYYRKMFFCVLLGGIIILCWFI